MQQFLKPTTGIAGAWIVAPKLFDKVFVAVYDALAALDPSFGRKTAPTFASYLETESGRGVGFRFHGAPPIIDAQTQGARL
jgi:hypothetical protein